MFITYGANINHRTYLKRPNTALHKAVQCGHVDIVELLLKHRSDTSDAMLRLESVQNPFVFNQINRLLLQYNATISLEDGLCLTCVLHNNYYADDDFRYAQINLAIIILCQLEINRHPQYIYDDYAKILLNFVLREPEKTILLDNIKRHVTFNGKVMLGKMEQTVTTLQELHYLFRTLEPNITPKQIIHAMIICLNKPSDEFILLSKNQDAIKSVIEFAHSASPAPVQKPSIIFQAIAALMHFINPYEQLILDRYLY